MPFKLKILRNRKLIYEFKNDELIIYQQQNNEKVKLMRCYYNKKGWPGFEDTHFGCQRFYTNDIQTAGCRTFDNLITYMESELGRKVNKEIAEKFYAMILKEKL